MFKDSSLRSGEKWLKLNIYSKSIRQALESLICGLIMVSSLDSSLRRDESGMTAVIEFLSAFTLFLMILTAFLSLAQLEMGSNDTSVDRLDRAAAQGLDRLTSDGGWFVPVTDSGVYDYSNSTSEWHLKSLEDLNSGIVLAGLIKEGSIDFQRISALRNVTEDNFAAGLGLSDSFSINVEIKIIDSDDINRDGMILFSGGTERGTAKASSSSFKLIQTGQETIQIILEVHNGGRKANNLIITEISPRSVSGSPEWIEFDNPNDFAIDLNGWSLSHISPNLNTNLLLREGVVSGLSKSLMTGDPNSQQIGSADHVIDLGELGFLGVGQLNLLDDGGGVIILSYTQLSEFQPFEVMRVEWGGDSGFFLTPSQSLEYIPDNFPPSILDWQILSSPSPGN
tara:strand:+ start:2078 stop:3265 length:1188 start_codon:yes stop_codon:yes gene_type:complete